jgi:hypothetical protein
MLVTVSEALPWPLEHNGQPSDTHWNIDDFVKRLPLQESPSSIGAGRATGGDDVP